MLSTFSITGGRMLACGKSASESCPRQPWSVSYSIRRRICLSTLIRSISSQVSTHKSVLTYIGIMLTIHRVEHGGEVSYKYKLSNNYVLTKYGRPSYFLRHRMSTPSHSGAPSPSASRPLSRISSLESMRETFYSAAGTPRSLAAHSPSVSHTDLQGYKQKHPAWLDMTLTTASTSLKHVPKMQANGLQLASPMASPKRSSADLHTVSSSSGIRLSRDANDQETLEEKYYEYEESDASLTGGPDDTWDQESLTSERSAAGDSGSSRSGRGVRGNHSPDVLRTPSELQRASSLARLRTQLEENDISRVPSSRGKSSGTLVSSYPAIMKHTISIFLTPS